MEENKRAQTMEEGMAMFLLNREQDPKYEVYFAKDLPDKYKKYVNLAGSIIRLRNIVIVLTFLEIFSSLWGFSYYFIRRSAIYIVVNCTALALSLLGVYSTITLNEVGLIIYSLLTTSLPGTFFFYQIFEFFAIKDTSFDSKRRLNDNILLGIFSLPYLYDFVVGIVTIVLMSKIATLNTTLQKIRNEDEEASKKLIEEEMEKLADKYSYEHLKNTFINRESGNNNLTCIICMDRPREVLNRPCNDILMCESCSEEILQRACFRSPTCPKCRRSIENFEKFFT